MKVFISPSNQDDNKYAYGNTNEMVQCGKIAQELKTILEKHGFDVMVVHDALMSEKVRTADSWGADLYIPIHTNAFNGSVMGTRMFYYTVNGEGHKLCSEIYKKLSPMSPGTSDNMTQNTSFYELIYPKAWCCYIEVEFHDTLVGAKWIVENTNRIAEAIAKGICSYAKVPYKDEPETAPAPVPTAHLYRVRKEWSDASSQIGAYAILDNAKKACPRGYKVFDETGKIVWEPTQNVNIVDPAKKYDRNLAGLYKIVANGGLNLRCGASKTKPVINVLDNGSYVRCYGYYTDDWLLVVDEVNKTGFVNKAYLNKV